MIQRGTTSRSKADFASEVEQMGAKMGGKTDREISSLTMSSLKGDSSKVVELLGDCFSNATFDSAEVELTKQEMSAMHEGSFKNLMEQTIEQGHYNSYREHMMGQPIKGDRDMVQSLTVDGLHNYRAANYFGDNMIVVGTGNIDHEKFVADVNQAFGTIGKDTQKACENAEKNIFGPGLMFVRDDEMVNSNVVVYYDAPSVKDPDYYGFLLLKHMFGSYRIDKHAEHLNDTKKQYNSMHSLLGDLVDVTLGEAMFHSYSDSGLFGNYFFGNEVFTRQMNYCGVCLPTIYSHYMNDVEVIRSRNHIYNTLMNNTECQITTNEEVGLQMVQQGRRVPRSEVAKRISHFDAYHMKHMCNEWFYDAEPTFTNWGPVETTASAGSYKYYKVNTMSTVANMHHTLFQ
jgi:processing peptidase subunit beta